MACSQTRWRWWACRWPTVSVSPSADRRAIRARLGWPQDLPVILLVGGGDGMGPLEKTRSHIASAGMNASLVVVSGHNRRLKAQLGDLELASPHLYLRVCA